MIADPRVPAPPAAARLFVASLPSPATTEQLLAVQRTWKERAVEAADARLVAGDMLHLTLRYLGVLDAGCRAALQSDLAVLASRRASVRCTLDAIEHWPACAPKVVVLAGTAGPDVQSLVDAVEMLARGLGVPAETRPFRPHVTLARLRGSVATCASAAERRAGACIRFAVDALVLVQSSSVQGGVRYQVLQRFPLR